MIWFPQQEWNAMYKNTLPSLAKARSPIQPKWPVTLDHCFARIILDNAVGITKPWTEVVKAPAVKTMSKAQICAAIELGQQIAEGKADLVALNEKSLSMRGKDGPGGRAKAVAKRKRDSTEEDHENRDLRSKKSKTGGDGGILKYFQMSPTKTSTTSALPVYTSSLSRQPRISNNEPSTVGEERPYPVSQDNTTSLSPQKAPQTDPLTLIATSALTPFRKEVLSLICGIPLGQWTSYAAMSRHVNRVRSKTSQPKTCARAIGNAMRNNPFAPMVPCHRVLATDGSIGGFGGDWGEDGKHASEKKRLLREEGVRFDGKGKAVGSAWEGWK